MSNSGILDVPRRRAMLIQAAALAAAFRAGHRGSPGSGQQDGALLQACAGFCDIERGKLALFYGPDRVVDDDERTLALLPLDAAQAPFVDAMCQLSASGLLGDDGLQTRAGHPGAACCGPGR